MPSYELFKVAEQGSAGALHAGGWAALDASVSVRRGIAIEAQAAIGLMGDAGAAFEGVLGAALAAGVQAELRAGLQAGLPMDLFGECGVVARARLQAALGGFVRAELHLDADDLTRGITSNPRLQGPWRNLAMEFLRATNLSAGVFAHAGLAAEIVAQASLTGRLVSNDPRLQPGFSAIFDWQAGFGLGTGYSATVNLSIPEPQQLISSLAEIVTDALRGAAAALGPGATGEAARASIPAARVLVALSLQAAWLAGETSLKDSPRASSGEIARAILQAFAVQTRGLLTTGAIDAGLNKAADAAQALEPTLTDPASIAHDQRPALASALRTSAAELEQLAQLGPTSNQALAPLLVTLEGICDVLAPIRSPEVAILRRALALSAAAAAAWGHCDASARTWSLDTQLAPLETLPNTLASEIESVVGRKPATVAHLLQFLGAQKVDLLDELVAARPELSTVCLVVRELVEGASRSTLRLLFEGFPVGDPFDARHLVQVLRGGLEGQFTRLAADLFAPLSAAGGPIADLIVEIAAPLPRSFISWALDAVANFEDTPEGRAALREGMSVLLMHSLTRLVLETTEEVMRQAATLMQQWAPTASQAMKDRLEEGPLALPAAMAGFVWSLSPWGFFIPTPWDVANAVEFAGKAMGQWDAKCRAAWFDALEEAVSFGLATSDDKLRTALSKPNEAPAELKGLLTERVLGGSLEVASALTGDLLLLLARRYTDPLGVIARALADFANAVVESAKRALREAKERVGDAANQIGLLGGQILNTVEAIARDVAACAARLRAQVDDLIDRLVGIGAGIAEAAFSWAGPDIARQARRLFGAALRALLSGAAEPLRILLLGMEKAAEWSESLIKAQLSAGQTDPETLRRDLRELLLARLPLRDITIEINLAFVTIPITVPAGSVANAVANAVLEYTFFAEFLAGVYRGYQEAKRLRAEQQIWQTAEQNALVAEQGAAVANVLTLPTPPDVRIRQEPYIAGARVRYIVQVGPANTTFVAETAGVPRRVSIRVNGNPVYYRAQDWSFDGTTLEVMIDIVGVPLADATPPLEPYKTITAFKDRPVVEIVSSAALQGAISKAGSRPSGMKGTGSGRQRVRLAREEQVLQNFDNAFASGAVSGAQFDREWARYADTDATFSQSLGEAVRELTLEGPAHFHSPVFPRLPNLIHKVPYGHAQLSVIVADGSGREPVVKTEPPILLARSG